MWWLSTEGSQSKERDRALSTALKGTEHPRSQSWNTSPSASTTLCVSAPDFSQMLSLLIWSLLPSALHSLCCQLPALQEGFYSLASWIQINYPHLPSSLRQHHSPSHSLTKDDSVTGMPYGKSTYKQILQSQVINNQSLTGAIEVVFFGHGC